MISNTEVTARVVRAPQVPLVVEILTVVLTGGKRVPEETDIIGTVFRACGLDPGPDLVRVLHPDLNQLIGAGQGRVTGGVGGEVARRAGTVVTAITTGITATAGKGLVPL